MGSKKAPKPPSSGKKTGRASKSSKPANGTKKTTSQERSSTTESGDSMKMTMCTAPTMVPRTPPRRPGRPSTGKRFATARTFPGKIRATARRSLDPCDNSNDSGLGFDNHFDPYSMGHIPDRIHGMDDRLSKRARLDVKLEDEINDSYSFPEHMIACEPHRSTTLIRTAPASTVPSLSISTSQSSSSTQATPRSSPLVSRTSSTSPPITLATQLTHASKYGDISLNIVCQPEQQHRARYQTEGSRGAVKDRSGNSFPMVKLHGYNKPVTLQVFIGTDTGKVAPHMFYQACRVSGKNSTPCTEKKIEGTVVIELLMDPAKEMTAAIDCVGILKERNVDVEHRFPGQHGSRSKKKSTRCRMIFRATITHDDGMQETLQVCSQPIVCTQPPGIPEIIRKSINDCPATGGLDVFIVGKNFAKDAKVYFQDSENGRIRWETVVTPEKDVLAQNLIICTIPPYVNPNITEPATVKLFVVCSGKTSEQQQFDYTPISGAMPSVRVDIPSPTTPTTSNTPFLSKMLWPSLSKHEQDVDMMPPPGTSMVPLAQRRSSTNLNTTSDSNSPPLRSLKQELLDENTQSSILDPSDLRSNRFRLISESSLDVHQGDSNMSMINDNSMDILRQNHSINENSNMSLVNENSVELIVRRNSMSRSLTVCDSSLDVNVSNSNMSSLNEESSCSSVHQHTTDARMFSHNGLLTTVHSDMSNASIDDLKVMDLRKIPMATVADLANTSAPSLATLQSFGVTEASSNPLPTQSGLSVESYLTTLENKGLNSRGMVTIDGNRELGLKAVQQNIFGQKMNEVIVTQALNAAILSNNTQGLSRLGANPSSHIISTIEPSFISTQRPMMTAHQSNVLNMVAKSEAAAIAEQMVDQTTITTTVSSMPTSIENGMLASAMATERLDAFVNCAVESHISHNAKLVQTANPQDNIMISSQDVLLNSQNHMLVSPIINTAINASSPLQQNVTQTTNIATDVILNSQISPSLMCRNSATLIQDSLLAGSNLNAICHTSPNVESALLQQNMNMLSPVNQTTTSVHMSPNSQQPHMSPEQIQNIEISRAMQTEKDVILNATVDLLTTQKKIVLANMNMNIQENFNINNDNMAVQSNALLEDGALAIQNENNFVTSQYASTPTAQAESMASTNEMDKRNEDRMIPPSFPSMSDNDLINIINPTCFDQGNNFH